MGAAGHRAARRSAHASSRSFSACRLPDRNCSRPMIAGDMSCEVRSMNSFRSSLPAGGGNRLPSSPLLSQKKKRGAESDDLTSIPIARDSRRNADHRDGDRHRLADEKIRIDHAGESREAELINLSGGGAMVEVDFTPRLWDRVELHLGSGV